ncbi:MAG: ABC transporter substrate-binding protein, partial [Thermocrispum sp.]
GLYTDLERLGKIFRVEERAEKVVADLREREAAVAEKAPKGDPVPVFLYDSGTDKPYTAGNQVPPNEIIETAGGRNVFDDLRERWTEVNWESVVEEQPEVIMIMDYGDKPAEEKIDFLKKSPHTRHLPAVKNENFFILDYNEGISGPRNIDGLEKFGTYLRELQH